MPGMRTVDGRGRGIAYTLNLVSPARVLAPSSQGTAMGCSAAGCDSRASSRRRACMCSRTTSSGSPTTTRMPGTSPKGSRGSHR
jgi:hypothetical protein